MSTIVDARRLRVLPSILGAILAMLTLAGPVLADVELEASDPAADAQLEVAPTSVVLEFSGPLVTDKSSFTVEGPTGDVGTGRVSADADNVMSLDGLELAPGEYEVRWTAGSEDGHLVRGRLTFTVLEPTPPPATPTPAPTDGPSAIPTAAPTPGSTLAPTTPSAVPEPSPDGGTDAPVASTGDVLLPIVVGLALASLVGVLVLRRGRAA